MVFTEFFSKLSSFVCNSDSCQSFYLIRTMSGHQKTIWFPDCQWLTWITSVSIVLATVSYLPGARNIVSNNESQSNSSSTVTFFLFFYIYLRLPKYPGNWKKEYSLFAFCRIWEKNQRSKKNREKIKGKKNGSKLYWVFVGFVSLSRLLTTYCFPNVRFVWLFCAIFVSV